MAERCLVNSLEAGSIPVLVVLRLCAGHGLDSKSGLAGFDSLTACSASWSSLEWTPVCHAGERGFKSHRSRLVPVD